MDVDSVFACLSIAPDLAVSIILQTWRTAKSQSRAKIYMERREAALFGLLWHHRVNGGVKPTSSTNNCTGKSKALAYQTIPVIGCFCVIVFYRYPK